jgi:hypothetical protein
MKVDKKEKLKVYMFRVEECVFIYRVIQEESALLWEMIV